MRKKLFKIGGMVLSVIIVVSLFVGCSGKKEEAKNEITFWHAMGGELGRVLDEMIADYNKTNPPMKVKGVNMGTYTALSQKISASARIHKLPALAQVYEAWSTSFYNEGLVVPAQKFIDKDSEFKNTLSDVFPAFIKGNSINGKLISFPFNKSVRALYYNKKMFREHGFTHPPQNWDEFLDYAKKLTVWKNGKRVISGTAMVKNNGWAYENLLLQFGGEFLTPDNKKVAFVSKAGIDALQYMADLIFKYKVAYITPGYEFQNDFLAGRVAMVEGSTVSIKFMEPQMPKDFELGLAPVPVAKRKAMIIQGTNVAIFSDVSEKEQEAAWAFVKWFTNTKNTARWSMGTFYLPVRKSAIELPEMQKWMAQYEGLKEVFDQINYPAFEPNIAAWFRGRDELIKRAISAVLTGNETDVKKALETAAKKIQKELDKQNEK